jgi:fumarate hydratase class II
VAGHHVHPNDGREPGPVVKWRVPYAIHIAAALRAAAADDLFAAMAGPESLVDPHAALRTLPVSNNKIANDIRLMGHW